jgi:hypothetical protein
MTRTATPSVTPRQRRRLPALAGAAAVLSALLGVSAADAQAPASSTTSYVSNAKVARLADKPQGWSYNLKLAANINVAGNSNVVGQVNGRSLLLGASVLSTIGYLQGPHEWLNTGSLTETWSKTPAVDRYVKSNDVLDLQSLYNYFLNDFTGPFGRVSAQTSILPTKRVTPGLVGYDDSGTAEDESTTQRRRVFDLSNGFQPFTLTESAGWFVQPLHSDRINAFGRAGIGGRHTFAEGARAVTTADITAATVSYSTLKDVHQGGAELFAGVDGKEIEGKLIYSVGLSALFPVVNNDNTNRSILELTKVALQAQAGIGVFSWMSLNYQLKVIRDFQLIDKVQVQNALLLSFQYQLASPVVAPPPAPIAPEVQARLEELETRAQTAEARAQAAEARATGGVAPAATAPVAPAAPAPSASPAAAPLAPAPAAPATP